MENLELQSCDLQIEYTLKTLILTEHCYTEGTEVDTQVKASSRGQSQPVLMNPSHKSLM